MTPAWVSCAERGGKQRHRVQRTVLEPPLTLLRWYPARRRWPYPFLRCGPPGSPEVVEYLAKGRDFGGRYIDYRTALLHSLRGTPEPLRSTVPAMLMAPPSFYVWGRRSWAGREGE